MLLKFNNSKKKWWQALKPFNSRYWALLSFWDKNEFTKNSSITMFSQNNGGNLCFPLCEGTEIFDFEEGNTMCRITMSNPHWNF